MNTYLTDKADKDTLQKYFTEVQYGKRQRSSPNTVMRSQKQTKLNYWLASPEVPTTNSFTGLDDIQPADKPEIQAPKPSMRPTPLFIDVVKNIQPLIQL